MVDCAAARKPANEHEDAESLLHQSTGLNIKSILNENVRCIPIISNQLANDY